MSLMDVALRFLSCAMSFVSPVFEYLFLAAWSIQKRLMDWTLQTEIKNLTTKEYKNGKPFISTLDPEFAKRVLNMKQSPLERPISQQLKIIEEIKQECFNEREWSFAFKVMEATFSNKNNMESFVEKSALFTDRYVRILKEEVEARPNEWHLYSFLKFFAIDSMMYAVYGMDLRIIDDLSRPILMHLEDLESPTSSWLTKKVRDVYNERRPAASAFEDLGRDVIGCLLTEKPTEPEPVGCSFVKNFIRHPKYFHKNDEELATSSAMLLIIAGAENIAFTLYTCLYLLARNPKKQAAMRDEIVRVLGDREKLELKDSEELKYVEGAIRETLRLFPLDASLKRIANKTGSICGIQVEEGTPIEIKLREMNLHHENFPDPWNFKPERFCDPNVMSQQKLDALLTFGSGRGSCLAGDFAIDVMKSFLARFLLSFETKKTPETPILFYLPADRITSDHFVNKNKFASKPLYIGLSILNPDTAAE